MDFTGLTVFMDWTTLRTKDRAGFFALAVGDVLEDADGDLEGVLPARRGFVGEECRLTCIGDACTVKSPGMRLVCTATFEFGDNVLDDDEALDAGEDSSISDDCCEPLVLAT